MKQPAEPAQELKITGKNLPAEDKHVISLHFRTFRMMTAM
jgi:hypothetical protein